jgi:hypothetical protein
MLKKIRKNLVGLFLFIFLSLVGAIFIPTPYSIKSKKMLKFVQNLINISRNDNGGT